MLLTLLIIISIVYLFFNCNGSIEQYESRKDIMSNYIKEYMIDYIVIKNKNNKNYKQLNCPLVFKPTRCNRASKGIKIINNDTEANEYLNNLDKNDFPIIAQKYYYGREITIMYLKHPITNEIKLILVERVNKNLNNTINKKYIWNKNQSEHDKQHILRNNYITDKLKLKVHEITSKLPNVNICRYDIKFNDVNKLMNGEDINIIEVNLSMGFNLYIKTKKTKLEKNIIRLNFLFTRIIYGLLKALTLNLITPYTFFTKVIPTNINMLLCD